MANSTELRRWLSMLIGVLLIIAVMVIAESESSHVLPAAGW